METSSPYEVPSFLIIQTAFIGDVILATPVLEKIHQYFPDSKIDFLLRKGNEQLFEKHPFLNEVLIWNKKQAKYKNLWKLTRLIRKKQYTYVINLQRFLSTGFVSAFSNASHRIGFDKNPMAVFFTKKVAHQIAGEHRLKASQPYVHEVDRNLSLIAHLTDGAALPAGSQVSPKLYPDQKVFTKVKVPQQYYCMAPTSVWFTKQWPAEKWIELINKFSESEEGTTIYLLGAPNDVKACESIKIKTKNTEIINLAGRLNLLESAALMQKAKMNFVNDSAPLHMASATNAPVVSIFCSTIPAFGFAPLSDVSYVMETEEELECRPCGLHGFKACPKGHFKCSDISIEKIFEKLKS